MTIMLTALWITKRILHNKRANLSYAQGIVLNFNQIALQICG